MNVPPASIPMRMLRLDNGERNAFFSKSLKQPAPDGRLHGPSVHLRRHMNDELHLEVRWSNSRIEPDARRRLLQHSACIGRYIKRDLRNLVVIGFV